MMLKVKLKVNPENYEYFKNELEKLGISIDDGAELTLLEENLSQSISVRKEDDIYIIPVESIIYIESFGHNIVIHREDGQYNKRDTLANLQNILRNDNFIRINNSTIVNKEKIKHIRPIIGMKFDLLLVNGSKTLVTRSYYYQFKEAIGF
jgi:two-component system response regulator LytT